MQSQLDSCMQVMRRAVGASTIENENVLSIVTELARENSNLREMLRIDSSIKEY